MRAHRTAGVPRHHIHSGLLRTNCHQRAAFHQRVLAEGHRYVYLYFYPLDYRMFRKRYRQQIPELNTTSTADISFMLLIFFLVTSSMDTDKGLLRQMPPPPIENQQPRDVNKDHVVQVEIDGHDRLTCDGKEVTTKELTNEVLAMAQLNPTGHVVTVQADRETSYEAYFRMQEAIVKAYYTLRDDYARKQYGHGFEACNAEERTQVTERYPQRISEDMKGGER